MKYEFSSVQLEHARSRHGDTNDEAIARIKKQTACIDAAPKKDRLKICNAFKHRLGSIV